MQHDVGIGCVGEVAFGAAALLDWLDSADPQALDAQPFGIIGIDGDSVATHYNRWESEAAGLRPERVIGRHFFDEVAPCMNNYLVAQRFEDEDGLDVTLPYTLTLRMRPTAVRLRLLRRAGATQGWLLVDRSATA